jgi:tyrosinase
LPAGLRPKGKNLTERTLWILQAYTEFAPMSHNRWADKSKSWTGWGSLEDIHNSVHGYVGGTGHMGDPSIAGFDPIFWLHHW